MRVKVWERKDEWVCVLCWEWVERVFVNKIRLVWGSVVKAIEFVRDREGEREKGKREWERERKRESESGLEKPIVTIVKICRWCWRRKKKDLPDNNSDHQNGDSVTTTKPKLFLFRREQKRRESKTPRQVNGSSWHSTTSFSFEVEWG